MDTCFEYIATAVDLIQGFAAVSYMECCVEEVVGSSQVEPQEWELIAAAVGVSKIVDWALAEAVSVDLRDKREEVYKSLQRLQDNDGASWRHKVVVRSSAAVVVHTLSPEKALCIRHTAVAAVGEEVVPQDSPFSTPLKREIAWEVLSALTYQPDFVQSSLDNEYWDWRWIDGMEDTQPWVSKEPQVQIHTLPMMTAPVVVELWTDCTRHIGT